MSVKVYFASATCSVKIKKQQSAIFSLLESKKIPYELVDICACDDVKQTMRDLAGKPTALPPQIFNQDLYCGDYDAFFEAVENENIENFLKV